MALLERVKERVEHALSDAELQRLIDEALAEIIQRYGPHADPMGPVSVLMLGGFPSLFPARPIDEGETIVIEETVADTTTTLAADDYRIWYRGRRLERLNDGSNPRQVWGGRVAITYTPVNDGNQREEVVIKLVELSITYEGVTKDSVGDTSTDYPDYTRERARLLASLDPVKIKLG